MARVNKFEGKSTGAPRRCWSPDQQQLTLTMYPNLHPAEFFSATNLNWLPVLQKEQHKKILVEALQKRIAEKQLTLYAFVIMPNHFHVIWRVHNDIDRQNFQRDLMKFTARSILKYMQMTDDPLLKELIVNTSDRNYQVWERNALSVELHSGEVFMQKLNYIHNNPIQPKWQLSKTPEEYLYSSAGFYETGGKNDSFNFLTHFKD